MKYKLINKQTGVETLCDKVTYIDGFDYYVSDNPNINDVIVYNNTIGKLVFTQDDLGQGYDIEIGEGVSYPILEPLNVVKKVIATNNLNIDIPKVVDEVKASAKEYLFNSYQKKYKVNTNDEQFGVFDGFIAGYNKSQETHPFSEEDMIEFAWFMYKNLGRFSSDHKAHLSGEYLKIWKDQKRKIVYYE